MGHGQPCGTPHARAARQAGADNGHSEMKIGARPGGRKIPFGRTGRSARVSPAGGNPQGVWASRPKHGWNHSVWKTVFGATPKTATGTVALPFWTDFVLDVWGNWRLNFLSRAGRAGGEVRRTGI